jgi:ribonuclease HI
LLGHRPIYVHIFTDSEYCRNMGTSGKRTVHKNGVLWAIFDVLAREGFMLRWHWIRRESVALNRYCDRLSRLSRILLEKYNLQERMLADQHDVKTLNP